LPPLPPLAVAKSENPLEECRRYSHFHYIPIAARPKQMLAKWRGVGHSGRRRGVRMVTARSLPMIARRCKLPDFTLASKTKVEGFPNQSPTNKESFGVAPMV
jgi:hypothetical protein